MSDHTWVATEECDVIWLPGHIRDRDERRRALAAVVNDELDWHAPFMELVNASRDYALVWMRVEPAPEWSAWAGGDWYKEHDHDGDDMMAYTRINVEDHIIG